MKIIWLFLIISSTVSFNVCAEQSVGDKAQNAERQTSEHKKLPKWFPPLVVKNHDVKGQNNPGSMNSKKKEAEKREIEDLAAQQGMNAAAQSMDVSTLRLANDTETLAKDTKRIREYTWWMAFASVFAAGFLLPTLIATGIAAWASRATLKETRSANISQLQPYVSIKSVILRMYGDADLGVIFVNLKIKLRNDGHTPVHNAGIEVTGLNIQAKGDTDQDAITIEDLFRADESSYLGQRINPRTSVKPEVIYGHEQVTDEVIFDTYRIFEFTVLGRIRFKDISTLRTKKHQFMDFMVFTGEDHADTKKPTIIIQEEGVDLDTNWKNSHWDISWNE